MRLVVTVYTNLVHFSFGTGQVLIHFQISREFGLGWSRVNQGDVPLYGRKDGMIKTFLVKCVQRKLDIPGTAIEIHLLLF